jgi:hypothetical protein
MTDADVSALPVSKEAEIDRKIEETARRISSGMTQPNDFSNINDLIRMRARLMTPETLRRKSGGR